MAEFTPNYNMKKPSDDDFYNVQDFNNNADIVDDELKKQLNRINATEYPVFTEANVDENIQSKESLPTLLGKIKRAITKISEHISADNPHSGSAPKKHKHSTEDMESGTLPLSRGGTGANTAAEALKKLGITVTASVINLLNGLNENIIDALAKKSDKDHQHAASDITSGTFSVSRIPNLAISKITNLQASLNAKQNDLGFTPVQQGGGTDMATNKIYIGWTGSKLKAQVDETDMGDIVTTGSANNTELPMSKVKDLPELVLTVMGLTTQFLSYRKSLLLAEEKGSAGSICLTKGSCGLLSSVYNNNDAQVGLWHFSSGSGSVSIVPIIPNNYYEITGSILDNEMVLTIRNNLGKSQRFAVNLIFNFDYID